MKKRLIVSGVVIFFVVLIIVCIYFGKIINPFQVEKIILNTCSFEVTYDHVELDSDDTKTFIMLYNLSRYAGEVNVDRPYMSFSVHVYLKGGSRIILKDYKESRIDVSTGSGNKFWVDNQLLYNYIMELIEKYDLVRE